MAVWLAAAPVGASAQTSEDQQIGQRHFETGQAYYDRGDFEGAIREFEQAYELTGLAELQYNLAQAYERLARWDEALAAYRKYLTAKPEAHDRTFVEQRIAFLESENIFHNLIALRFGEHVPTLAKNLKYRCVRAIARHPFLTTLFVVERCVPPQIKDLLAPNLGEGEIPPRFQGFDQTNTLVFREGASRFFTRVNEQIIDFLQQPKTLSDTQGLRGTFSSGD